MDSVVKPVVGLVAAAVAVVVGSVALYLGALLSVYVIAWVVQVLQNLG